MALIDVIMFIGGLAMLLFGIQTLSGSLCRLADGKLAHIVEESSFVAVFFPVGDGECLNVIISAVYTPEFFVQIMGGLNV